SVAWSRRARRARRTSPGGLLAADARRSIRRRRRSPSSRSSWANAWITPVSVASSHAGNHGATQAAGRRRGGSALRARARSRGPALLARHAAVLLPVQARHRGAVAARRAAALGSVDGVGSLRPRPAHSGTVAPGDAALPRAAVPARVQAEPPHRAAAGGGGRFPARPPP